MSLKSRKALAAAGVAAIAISGAAATSAQADFQKTLTYSCVYPYVGAQPLSVAINAAIPATWPAGKLTEKFVISAVATAGGDTSVAVATVGATTIEGITAAKSTVRATGQTLPLTVPIIIPKQAVAGEGDLILTASGTTPPIKFLNPGPATITVDGIALNLIARTAAGVPVQFDVIPPAVDSDENPDTFDVPCKLAPSTQSTTLANIDVTGPPTPTPIRPTPTPIVPTPTPVTPTPVGPTPTPGTDTTFIKYSYALAGSATLKTLVTGSLPLKGGINANLGLPSGNFKGDLTLDPTSGNLTALGFLPVNAQVVLVPTEQITGSLKGGKLTALAKVRIKLPKVTLFGLELAGGSTCQAKNISSITLRSTQTTFLPLSGGPIAGTFTISDLTGCGALTGIVSPLTAGSGNAIALNLTPRPVPAGF